MSGYFYSPLSGDESQNGSIPNGSTSASNGSIGSYWTSFSRSGSASQPSAARQLPAWCPTFSLSRSQRYVGFLACIMAGSICFLFAGFCLPVLIFQARKFSLLFTLGSLFLMGSFSLLWGPWEHAKHIFSRDRLPFTAAYLGTLIATLYSALSIQSTILTTIFAILQIIALMWYVLSYVPGGTAGLKFVTSMIASSASRALPV